ncbi:blastula protease 10-like isoform X3 [Portunus trituberculatus]|uniref:blastula protease 10-like isoform X3 n=1 Tax=Portunus trituberculatus TaxID=210409 RepID=UPI001E1CEC41|nr:blastula protease 10-like isoform X3 [Portunus trituberculatus]
MGYSTLWLSLALCLSAFAAVKGNETTEPPLMPFDGQDPPAVTMFDGQDPPAVTMFDEQDPQVITMFDDEEFEDDDESNMAENEEGELEVPLRDFMDTNPTEVKGDPVFEGDILLTQGQWRAMRERKGIAYETSYWTNGNVPYRFVSSGLNQDVIRSGIDHWMEHTCLTFEETTNTNQPHLKFIYGGGCYSYIGQLNQNGQDISIGSGCDYLGIVAHEIGHAIGFFHEQSRPDRDDHVVINYENIQDNRESNFNKYSTNAINSHNIPYDYSSDMHYGSTGFTINGKTTIATKDRLAQTLIGQRAGLSHRDKHLANIMYKCTDKWLTMCGVTTDPCQNGGYYRFYETGCACVCPPGTSGSNCETETGNYYEALLSPCSEIVTTEGTLQSPNHPNNYPTGPEGQCVKWIQAPECYVPKVTFSAFNLFGQHPYCSGNTCCYFDALEIRTDNLNYGDVFCSDQIQPGRSFIGTGREMVLYFRTKTNYRTGWSADLTFEKQEGCEPASVSTTSTSTTTTTTTTAVTSTTEEEETNPNCLLEYYNGKYYWSSPDFGMAEYPNDFTCGLRGSASPGVYGLLLKMNTFETQGKKNRRCVDKVQVTMVGGKTRTLCGNKTGSKVASPSFNFELSFTTDEAITAQGYNISVEFIPRKCNKVLTPALGETGTIATSKYQRLCEYRIVAPAGSQVRIDEITPSILDSDNCKKDHLLINGNSEVMYPRETSTVICGSNQVTSPITSTTGEMYIAYTGSRRSQGFTLDYTIV